MTVALPESAPEFHQPWLDEADVVAALEGLTPKQRRFVILWSSGRAPTTAAGEAYGGSANSHSVTAKRNVRVPKLIEAQAVCRPHALSHALVLDEDLRRCHESLGEELFLELHNRTNSIARQCFGVLSGIRAGLTFEVACAGAGVSNSDWSRWLERWPTLREECLRARAIGSHALAEQCLEIADGVVADKDAVAKARLRVETRLKLIGKWNRAFYGDEVEKVAQHTFILNADLGG